MTVIIMNNTRVRLIKEGKNSKDPVAYWMSRDQRARDNWALIFAQDIAMKQQAPLAVIFCLVPQFLHATVRHYDFMLTGLKTVEESLSEKNMNMVHPVDAYFFQLKKMDIQPQKEIVEDFRLMEGKHIHEFFVPWIWSCRLRLC